VSPADGHREIVISLAELEGQWNKCELTKGLCTDGWLYDPGPEGQGFKTLGSAVRSALSTVGVGRLARIAREVNEALLARDIALWPELPQIVCVFDASLKPPAQEERVTHEQWEAWREVKGLAANKPPTAPSASELAAQRVNIEDRLRLGGDVYLWAYYHNGINEDGIPRYQLIRAQAGVIGATNYVTWKRLTRPEEEALGPDNVDAEAFQDEVLAGLKVRETTRCTWNQFWNMPTEATWDLDDSPMPTRTHEVKPPVLVHSGTSIVKMVEEGCDIMSRRIEPRSQLEQHEVLAEFGMSRSPIISMIAATAPKKDGSTDTPGRIDLEVAFCLGKLSESSVLGTIASPSSVRKGTPLVCAC